MLALFLPVIYQPLENGVSVLHGSRQLGFDQFLSVESLFFGFADAVQKVQHLIAFVPIDLVTVKLPPVIRVVPFIGLPCVFVGQITLCDYRHVLSLLRRP